MLKAILFDLDDTLIDWGYFEENWELMEDDHLPGVYTYLCTLGAPRGDLPTFKKAYLKRTRNAWMSARNTLIAPHLGKILVETAIEFGIPSDKLSIEKCMDVYKWGKVRGTFAFPDVIENLRTLKSKGLRFGIVTNAFQPMMLRDVEMQQHGLLEFFPECRFAAADVGFLKPHPKIFEAALNCLGLLPEEVIFIGDNPTADIAGAQAAGMKGILRVNHGVKPMLSGLIVPDAAINSLDELPAILEMWYPGWEKRLASDA